MDFTLLLIKVMLFLSTGCSEVTWSVGCLTALLLYYFSTMSEMKEIFLFFMFVILFCSQTLN